MNTPVKDKGPIPGRLKDNLISEMEKIPDSHFAIIGKIASSWTGVEILLDFWICILLKLDRKKGASVTAQIPNLARRLDALLSLIRLEGCSEQNVKKLNSQGEKLIKLSLKRNNIVHANLGLHSETGEPTILNISARKRLIYEDNEPFKLTDAEKVLSDIISAIDEMHILIYKAVEDLVNQRATPQKKP